MQVYFFPLTVWSATLLLDKDTDASLISRASFEDNGFGVGPEYPLDVWPKAILLLDQTFISVILESGTGLLGIIGQLNSTSDSRRLKSVRPVQSAEKKTQKECQGMNYFAKRKILNNMRLRDGMQFKQYMELIHSSADFRSEDFV